MSTKFLGAADVAHHTSRATALRVSSGLNRNLEKGVHTPDTSVQRASGQEGLSDSVISDQFPFVTSEG